MRAKAMGLRATGVTVARAGRRIVDDVSLDVGEGEVLGIVGPNGSGKSTLLRCLAGLLTPTLGTIRLGDDELSSMRRRDVARRLAYVEQSSETDVDLRVEEVVGLGRLPFRSRLDRPSTEDDARCAEALSRVGLDGFGERRWSTLSGGERQRVQLARAFAQDPTIILLDEPTNHLDLHHRFLLMDLLRASGATVVVVLHDLEMAAMHCDRVLVMQKGRSVGAGPPTEVLTERLIDEVFRVRAVVDRSAGSVSLRFLGRSR